MSAPANISLAPATKADFPALVSISVAANPPDAKSKVQNGDREETLESREQVVKPALEGYSESPNCRFVKAVDEKTGEIVGWIIFAVYQPEKRNPVVDPPSGSVAEKPQTPSLGSATGKDLEHWHNHYMGGKRHMIICMLAVHPDHQSRGVGAALVKSATDKADAEGLPSWVHSSHVKKSVRFYEKCGFEVVETSAYDLDEYVVEKGEGGRGIIEHSHMMRPGKKAA